MLRLLSIIAIALMVGAPGTGRFYSSKRGQGYLGRIAVEPSPERALTLATHLEEYGDETDKIRAQFIRASIARCRQVVPGTPEFEEVLAWQQTVLAKHDFLKEIPGSSLKGDGSPLMPLGLPTSARLSLPVNRETWQQVFNPVSTITELQLHVLPGAKENLRTLLRIRKAAAMVGRLRHLTVTGEFSNETFEQFGELIFSAKNLESLQLDVTYDPSPIAFGKLRAPELAHLLVKVSSHDRLITQTKQILTGELGKNVNRLTIWNGLGGAWQASSAAVREFVQMLDGSSVEMLDLRRASVFNERDLRRLIQELSIGKLALPLNHLGLVGEAAKRPEDKPLEIVNLASEAQLCVQSRYGASSPVHWEP